ncbi:iron-sulfur cluster assembly scaffold protein [candidate division WWE3 bacterium]|nr:iron-sulfur cluster assembly scaffold protein [candidate division WWE3 bacterium]
MDIYREELLDHYKNPRNYGRLEHPTHSILEANPLCGDWIYLTVSIKNGSLREVNFEGEGCAISIASASMLFDKVKGMAVDAIGKMSDEEAVANVGGNISQTRIKCATLALKALKKVIRSKSID